MLVRNTKITFYSFSYNNIILTYEQGLKLTPAQSQISLAFPFGK